MYSTATLASSPRSGLDAFHVAVTGYDVKITWTTHSTKAKAFEVQVATQANDQGILTFSQLAELPAGTTPEYEFTDNTPGKEGIRYYRVKQTESDGKVSYTETATANFQHSENFTLSVSTAPNLTSIDLGVSTEMNDHATVTLTSLVSTFTQTVDLVVTNGTTQHSIQVDPTAPGGPYLLSFELNGVVQLRLITKETGESMIVNN
jgi:hypothetical protein